MNTLGLRRLNSLALPPSRGDLAEWVLGEFLRLVPADEFGSIYDGARGDYSIESARRWALNSADFALENWDPRYRERFRLAGRKGGLVRKFSGHDLASVAHLSVRKAAEALGCSPSTVMRFRALKALRADPRAALLAFRARRAEYARMVAELAGIGHDPIEPVLMRPWSVREWNTS